MVGVSILRSSAKMSSDKVMDVSGMERFPCDQCAVLARMEPAGKGQPSRYENHEDEDREDDQMHETRQDVGAATAESHEADREGQHQQDGVVHVDAEFESLVQGDRQQRDSGNGETDRGER